MVKHQHCYVFIVACQRNNNPAVFVGVAYLNCQIKYMTVSGVVFLLVLCFCNQIGLVIIFIVPVPI
jgi:hypothetical protein